VNKVCGKLDKALPSHNNLETTTRTATSCTWQAQTITTVVNTQTSNIGKPYAYKMNR